MAVGGVTASAELPRVALKDLDTEIPKGTSQVDWVRLVLYMMYPPLRKYLLAAAGKQGKGCGAPAHAGGVDRAAPLDPARPL